MADTAPWITYRPAVKSARLHDSRRRADQQPSVQRRAVSRRLRHVRRGGRRLHGGGLQGVAAAALRAVISDHAVYRRGWLNGCSPITTPKKTGLKLCVMADAGKCDWREQIVP